MPIKKIKQYVDWVVEGDHTTQLRLDMMKEHKKSVLAEISLMETSLHEIDLKIARYTNRIQAEKQKNNGKEEAR